MKIFLESARESILQNVVNAKIKVCICTMVWRVIEEEISSTTWLKELLKVWVSHKH